MGDVIAEIKLLPSEDVEFEEMKSKVEKTVKAERLQEIPIAFGLKALKVTVRVPDAEGGTENIEKDLNDLKEVRSVEVVGLGRT